MGNPPSAAQPRTWAQTLHVSLAALRRHVQLLLQQSHTHSTGVAKCFEMLGIQRMRPVSGFRHANDATLIQTHKHRLERPGLYGSSAAFTVVVDATPLPVTFCAHDSHVPVRDRQHDTAARCTTEGSYQRRRVWSAALGSSSCLARYPSEGAPQQLHQVADGTVPCMQETWVKLGFARL